MADLSAIFGASNTPLTIADVAIALKLPVFPCNTEKKPITAHGFKDAVTDPREIRAAFARSGAEMIGVPTGQISGLVVVDVDVKDGRQGMDWLNANSHRLGHTRTIRTGSGGLHLYYKWPGQTVRNSASKLAPGIDFRGDGGYIIAPGSPGYEVADSAPMADVPDWLLPALAPPEPEYVPPVYRAPPRLPDDTNGSSYGLAALDDECTAMRNAMPGNQERTLNEAGLKIGALVAGGEIIEGYALAELLSACRGMFSQPGRNMARDEAHVRRSFADGMRKPRSAPAVETKPLPLPSEAVARIPAKPAALAPDLPPGLLDVDGCLGQFVAYCMATSISPQPFLALAAGIVAIGALGGRRYQSKTNLRTNIYAIGIADSGGGKDHARQRVRAIFAAAGLTQYLGGEEIASGSGLITALHRFPCQLFQIDEFGDWMTAIVGKNAGAHKQQIAAYFKKLYTSAGTYMTGTEFANQKKDGGTPREDLIQPHACVYGTTTPGQFWRALAGASIEDGLMPRFLVCISPESYPDRQEPANIPIPHALISAFQAIASGPQLADHGNLSQVMSCAVEAFPYLVCETPEAERAIKALRDHETIMLRGAKDDNTKAVAARWVENAIKLALIAAISRNPAHPIIEGRDVAWGRTLATYCADSLLLAMRRHVADSDYERKENKCLDIIRRHGKPITEREMMLKGFRHPKKDRTEILSSLAEAGKIYTLSEAAENGRTITYYTENISA